MKIDGKRSFTFEVERHDTDWWSVHVRCVDFEENLTTCSARNLGNALAAADTVVEREILLLA